LHLRERRRIDAAIPKDRGDEEMNAGKVPSKRRKWIFAAALAVFAFLMYLSAFWKMTYGPG